MNELSDLYDEPAYRATVEKLQSVKRISPTGVAYWLARDICPILGYSWEGFEAVIARAEDACAGIKVDPRHHFRQTSRMMKVGKGGKRRGTDYYLSRAACYLVAMNGDPSKPEVAAAQAYFTIQTRRMERQDEAAEAERRFEMRERVRTSSRKVSGVAKDAGLRNHMQAIFHNARYLGLYGMSYQKVKEKKGLRDREALFDRAGALELSANDFQMNLAADVIAREGIRGENRLIGVNEQLGKRVRRVITDSRGTMPEDLSLEPPISDVKKRVKMKRRKQIKK
jgi:DNA-damage-inducible protein D